MALSAPSGFISRTRMVSRRLESVQSSVTHIPGSDLRHTCTLQSTWKTGSGSSSSSSTQMIDSVCTRGRSETLTDLQRSGSRAVQMRSGGTSGKSGSGSGSGSGNGRPKTAAAAAVQERGYTQPLNGSFLGSILSPFRRVVLPKDDDVEDDVAPSLEPTTMSGKLIEDGMVYRERFVIRCYEVGVNRTASIESIANLMQEIGCNHAQSVGFSNDGFATTPLMRQKRLIWVTTRMHIEMDTYPKWGDVVEMDTWFQGEGNIVSRRDWVIRIPKTGTILGRGTSTWVTIHQDTRRLSKIPDDVRGEYMHYCPDPPRGDLDMNKHVNNVTYIGWMLESVPPSVFETAELAKITLEYRQEVSGGEMVESICMREEGEGDGKAKGGGEATNGAVFGSETSSSTDSDTDSDTEMEQYVHLLRLQESGKEVNRGRTVWRTKTDGGNVVR